MTTQLLAKVLERMHSMLLSQFSSLDLNTCLSALSTLQETVSAIMLMKPFYKWGIVEERCPIDERELARHLQ